MIKVVTVTGSGQITLPAELRRKHGIKAGDKVIVSEDAAGRIEVTTPLLSFEELAGSVKTPPGLQVDDDFGNVIRDAMDDRADRVVARMREHEDDE